MAASAGKKFGRAGGQEHVKNGELPQPDALDLGPDERSQHACPLATRVAPPSSPNVNAYMYVHMHAHRQNSCVLNNCVPPRAVLFLT